MWLRNLTQQFKKFQQLHSRKYTTQLKSSKLIPDSSISDLNQFKIGKKFFGFEVVKIEEIPEFRVLAIHLIHDKTKAEYLHLYRNDTNNVFSISFRTTPLNSTGLPHILEHTVLCGSELYPVRDPFFKMLNRSLATFMNALTGSDYTMYPFSTQNLADYQNLQKIYLDAAFQPNLKELDFMQEGWRLENLDLNDPNSQLIIKGVVYNEMKGAFSENDSILSQKIQNLILPDHTYGVISGGDPMEIPNLTWDDLKNFHKSYYHPSNSRLYSYGNFPLLPTLKLINDEYLMKFNYLEPNYSFVPKQKRWTNLKREHINCRFDNMGEIIEKQNAISISLLLTDIIDVYESFLMQFISELLIKGPNSPFYKSMIEPNISGGFTPSTGYDTQTKDSIFTIGLQGLQQHQFDDIVKIFDKTVDDVIAKGFDNKHIESVLHRYELSIKHETSNFGLNLLFGLTPIWNHNGDVFVALHINKLIDRLRNELKQDSKYLQKIIEKQFKDNQHRLILTMSPDVDYEKKQIELEDQLIKEKTKNLNNEEKSMIYQKCLQLQDEQNQKQNTDLLPTLTMQDINKKIEQIPITHEKINTIPLQINEVNSNGIIYFKGLLKTNDLSQEEQMLLPLFCNIITKLGTREMNYRDFDSLMNRKTSGLFLQPYINQNLHQLHQYEPNILITSYCLEKNIDIMWELWSQIFNINELNNLERFRMLIQLYMANLTHGIADSGHIYAMQAAASLVSGSSYQNELLTGLQHISYMKRLNNTSNYQAMLDEIVNIAKILFKKENLRCALNLSSESQSKALKTFENFSKDIPKASSSSSSTTTPTTDLPIDHTYIEGKVFSSVAGQVNCQHHIFNVPVYYCSKAILTSPYNTKDYATLRVLARLLSSKYLHPELREKNGAYGGGARLTQDGVFTFYSYRDPRHLQTLDIFDNSSKWLYDELDKITEQEVLEAKLGVFQSVDAPIPPSNKGCQEFLQKLTPDLLQQHRLNIMNVDLQQLKTIGIKYLENDDYVSNGKVILGPNNEKMDTSNRPNELWTVMND